MYVLVLLCTDFSFIANKYRTLLSQESTLFPLAANTVYDVPITNTTFPSYHIAVRHWISSALFFFTVALIEGVKQDFEEVRGIFLLHKANPPVSHCKRINRT